MVGGCVERLCSRYDGPVCGCVGDEMIGIGVGNVCCGSGACGGGIGSDVVLGNDLLVIGLRCAVVNPARRYVCWISVRWEGMEDMGWLYWMMKCALDENELMRMS